jgi:hypothetical protein
MDSREEKREIILHLCGSLGLECAPKRGGNPALVGIAVDTDHLAAGVILGRGKDRRNPIHHLGKRIPPQAVSRHWEFGHMALDG